MIIYRFDGSFDGLLTAVFDSFARKETPDELMAPSGEMPLFCDSVYSVETDEVKARRVWRKFISSVSKATSTALTAAFLTDRLDFPILALRFISRAVTATESIECDFSDPAVLAVVNEAKRVKGEAWRLVQFLRFQKAADGTYFSMMEPKFDVLPFVINHFSDRFSDQPFIIYDRTRNYGYHYDGKKAVRIVIQSDGYHMATGRLPDEMMDSDERLYQELWRNYVKYTAITERTNPRKQRQDMPVRYWKYLTEMQ